MQFDPEAQTWSHIFYLSRPGSGVWRKNGAFRDYTHPCAEQRVNEEYGSWFSRITSKKYRESRSRRYKQIRFSLRSQIRFLLREYDSERVSMDRLNETEGIQITGSNESDILTKKALISKGLEKILETRVIF